MASTNSNSSNLQREVLKNSNDIEATQNPHSLDQEDLKDPDSPQSLNVPDLPKNKGDLGVNTTAVISSADDTLNLEKIRPPIDYSSVGAFWRSSGRRFKSLWTRRFILSILAGQLLSFCLTSTSVITTELVGRGFNLSTTQSWFLYFSLFIIYTPYTIYQYGFKGWCKLLIKDGWKYIILAACDVEGNFLVVKAYQSTNILSCMLLDAWATPVCMIFTWIYMRTRFHWSQYLGVFICIVGLGLLVTSDQTHNSATGPGKSLIKGDLFMIAGATLYGITNATEEFLVRNAPLYQVVGQMGMWGMIINGIQAACLEHKGIKSTNWDAHVIGYLVVFTASMFILYTIAPLLYRMASSTYFNISILTSDFYGLIFGLFLFQMKPYWLYFPAFAIVIVGLIVYFWHTPPEMGKVNSEPPSYIQTRKARKSAQDLEASNTSTTNI